MSKILLKFAVFCFVYSANLMAQTQTDSTYYKQQKKKVIVGTLLNVSGLALEYGVALPLANKKIEANESLAGPMTLDLLGGSISMSGNILAGISAKRATDFFYKRHPSISDVDNFSWSLFTGGVIVGVTGGILRASAKSPYVRNVGTGAVVAGDILLLGHCSKAFSKIKELESIEKSNENGKVSFALSPVFSTDLVGIYCSVQF